MKRQAVAVVGLLAALTVFAQNESVLDQGLPVTGSGGSFSGDLTAAGVVSAAGFDGGWVRGSTGAFSGYVAGQDAGLNNLTATGTVDSTGGLRADSLQTHAGGAQGLSIGTTGTGTVLVGNGTSGTLQLISGIGAFNGGSIQVATSANIGSSYTNYAGIVGGPAAGNPVTYSANGTDAGFRFTTTGNGIMELPGYVTAGDAGVNNLTARGKYALTVLNATGLLGLQCGEKATSSGVVTITFSSEANGVAFAATPLACWCGNTSNTTENTCSTTGESATQVTLNGTTTDTYTWCCLGAAP